MLEFNELLQSVLAEDVCAEAPLGMERRIEAALSAAPEKRAHFHGIPHEVFAAALLLGVVGVLVRHHRVVTPTAEVKVRVFTAEVVAGGDVLEQPSLMKVAQKQENNRGPLPTKRSGRPSPSTVAVAPLSIESLTVPPIEIASLASDWQTKRFKERGE